MLIKGVKETNNENLRLIIDEMFGDLETTFNVKWIDCTYRLGPKRQGSDRRPIMLTFPFISYKHEIYRNAYKLKNINKWKGIYLQDDMSAPEQAKKKEIWVIYAYGKAQGLDVKVRGSNLVVDGVKYGPDEVLPHNLSIENVKTVNPIDPNPAIPAHAVFPQSGHIRPEKRLFFQKCPHFSKLEHLEN